MQFELRKKPVSSGRIKGRGIDPNQLIEPVLWVDGLASGYYQKPPDKPVFVSFDSSHETLLALRDMYPEWTFFGREIHGEYRGNSLRDISELQEGQQVHHIYLGNHLSFIDENSRSNLLDFINEHLAPGGYVVAGYESATGWSTYKVVIDVLRELVQGSNQVVDVDMLDKLFFELNKLAENKIMAFQGQAQLDKLLQHLKQMPSYHRDLLLRSEQFYTFYPSDVHRLLSGQGSQSLRFVGSLPIVRNYLHLGMSNAQKEFIGSADMSIVGAQRQDLVLMPLHRVDIWQRPADGHKERGELSDFYLGCLSDFDHFAPEVKAGHLKLKFSDAIYARLREACGQGFQTLEAIISQIIPFAKSSQEVANRLMLLVMGGQLSYTRTPPKFSQSEHTDEIGKIRFLHAGNAARFANVHTTGSIAIDGCGMVIPFDQKTSAVMAALTKVHESMVAEYCADIWVRADTSLDMDALVKEFKFVLGFFRRHYLGKFLAMGIVDRVLVDRVHNRNGDTWNRK